MMDAALPQSLNIKLIAIGSTGDVYPVAALGQALLKAGHQVTMVTHGVFESFIGDLGLGFIPLVGDYREFFNSKAGRRLLEGKSNVFTPTEQRFRDEYLLQLEQAWQACQDAELIGLSALAFAGVNIAEKLNVPCFVTSCFPFTQTRSFPVMGFGDIKPKIHPIIGLFNRMTYQVAELLMWHRDRRLINRFRRNTLKLKPLSVLGYRLPADKLSVIYHISPTILPPPVDWGSMVHSPGFFFFDANTAYQPPPVLVDFLDNETKPISIGFGSMAVFDHDTLADILLQVLKRTQKRVIILSGWAKLKDIDHERVLSIDYVPHDWLFPKMAAVVHHCAPGTMASALHAGIPQVSIPFFFDQIPFSQRIAQLGVSPQPIPFQQLTAERLVTAIEQATAPAMQQRAKALGREIQHEDGVASAVNILEKQFAYAS